MIEQRLKPFGALIEASVFEVPDKELKTLFFKHALLIFKNQTLTPAQLREVARKFGATWNNSQFLNCTLDPHQPDILRISSDKSEDLRPMGLFGEKEIEWHNDGSILPGNYFGSALYGRKGSRLATTSWCLTTPTLEQMPEALDPEYRKAEARFHCFTDEFDVISSDAYDAKRLEAASVKHPILKEHPILKKLGALVSPASILPGREKELALSLAEKLLRPEWIYTHHWSDGDLILFDNLQTMHKRSKVNGPGREVWRIQFDFANCGRGLNEKN